MAKNKKDIPLNDDATGEPVETKKKKSAKAPSAKNSLLMPWLLVFGICLLVVALICAWIEMDFARAINSKNRENHKNLFSQNIHADISNAFASTQKQLDSIAGNANIKTALEAGDTTQIDLLATTIASSFQNLVSFQIIPWDLTGTVGLKNRNIEPRNNVELMLISQAGSEKVSAPEAYLHEKKWYISFSAPVVKDGSVIGILLLTFDKNYLSRLVNIQTLVEEAEFSFYLKHQKSQIIARAGSAESAESVKLPMAFTDGELAITFDDQKLNTLKNSFLPVYIAMASLIGCLLLATLIAYRLCRGLINKDVISIQSYGSAALSLHKTKKPELLIPQLDDIMSIIDRLSERTTKTTVINEPTENYKSPQSNPLPEKMGIATVSDKNDFPHPDIFRDYDIRGLANDQLTTDIVTSIGKAIGSKALSLGIKTLVTGRDGRLSSERIQFDLARGILSTGCNVVNLGQVPSPVLYYATIKLETGAGVMVTGSHNPAEYNGFKIVLGHKTLQAEDIQDLLRRIEAYDFAEGEGRSSKYEVNADYIQDISSDIIIAKPLSVVIDAGNGVGGGISSQLLTMLDCNVTALYCDVDGKFPNHGPDPSIRANLTDLVNKVQETGADLGIAFDGDADRMVAVTATGQVIHSDQLLMLFAKDIVSRNAGSNIIYDVKCSRNVEKIVRQYGGRGIMAKSGHSNIKAKMQESDALLGGEFTGHFYFRERWNGFDDGIYAALRLIELLSTSNMTLDEEIATLPGSYSTDEIHINVQDIGQARTIVAKIQDAIALEHCRIDNTDGLRAEFDNGWALIRPSNTSSALSLRFEADSNEELGRIQALFKAALKNLNLDIHIPF